MMMLHDTTELPDSPLSYNNISCWNCNIQSQRLFLFPPPGFFWQFSNKTTCKLLLYKTDKSRTTQIKDSYRRKRGTWECPPSHSHGGPMTFVGSSRTPVWETCPWATTLSTIILKDSFCQYIFLESLQHIRHAVGTENRRWLRHLFPLYLKLSVPTYRRRVWTLFVSYLRVFPPYQGSAQKRRQQQPLTSNPIGVLTRVSHQV